MAARNDITGAEIKSRSLSAEGRDNWDKAFTKKTPAEWLRYEQNDTLLLAVDTPISYKEFCKLLNKNTL